ncbi:MAG: 4-hydroxybenzoate 3-monooxygenase [Burkholderiales bacterium]
MRTQVGIVGAGPAGLLLSHLLHLQGVETVVVENRSRDYIEQRVRAGVLEQGTVDLLMEAGVGERLRREAIVRDGIELRFGGRRHPLNLRELSGGRAYTVYAQQEIVKDLVHARLAANGRIVFEADGVSVHDFDTAAPRVRFRKDGAEVELRCDFIAGCDGFHGVCRPSIPADALTVFERVYPFSWLGILVEAVTPEQETVYAWHERGFGFFNRRSPALTRHFLQVAPDEDVANWPDERIWRELRVRLATDDGWRLVEGPVLMKGVTEMRSFVVEPMRYGRLYLAGDAAHIVPPTGAKGLNLAVADVRMLACALAAFYEAGRSDLLGAYSETCLRRIWRVEHFSWWMTSMLHRFPGDDTFQQRLQRSQLDYVVSSRAAATTLAENYVGLPWETGMHTISG